VLQSDKILQKKTLHYACNDGRRCQMLIFIDCIMIIGPVIWCRVFAVFLPWFLPFSQKSAVFFTIFCRDFLLSLIMVYNISHLSGLWKKTRYAICFNHIIYGSSSLFRSALLQWRAGVKCESANLATCKMRNKMQNYFRTLHLYPNNDRKQAMNKV